MLNTNDLHRGHNLSGIEVGNDIEADQNQWQGNAHDAAHVPANQPSVANATPQVATQPLPPQHPLESLQATASEHS